MAYIERMAHKPITYIHSVYQTKFGELWDRSWEDLVREAVVGALSDSKYQLSDIEAIYLGSMLPAWLMGQNNLGGVVAEALGVNLPIFPVEVACASGGVAFYQAVHAVESSQFERVLVVGVEKMTDLESCVITESLMGAASWQERQAGLTFPGLYGLMQRAYVQEYGLSEADLAQVPVKSHQYAKDNPKAHFGYAITADQVLASDIVADPIRLFHASGVSDGAAALIVSRDKSASKAGVLASEFATDTISLFQRKSLTSISATQIATKKAYSLAQIKPEQIDVLEVHDCFSIAQVMAMEDLGLAKAGRGVEAAVNVPVNTSGGLKACGHPVGATGVKQIVSLVEQLTGQSGKRQVVGARLGLAHNVAGSGSGAVVSVLEA